MLSLKAELVSLLQLAAAADFACSIDSTTENLEYSLSQEVGEYFKGGTLSIHEFDGLRHCTIKE